MRKAMSELLHGVRPWDGTREQEPFMAKMIFISLPVSDVARSTAFYQAIGAVKNEAFSDDHAVSCIAFSDTINAMLTTHEKYRQFTTKTIADARTTSGVLMCLFVESRQAVDDMIGKAKAAGGILDPSPVENFDFLYGRSFEDPDGHMWGVSWMDAEAAAKAMATPATA
jgi:predicted lactoylglutathione lyase